MGGGGGGGLAQALNNRARAALTSIGFKDGFME